jgi:hypothetical protein
MPTHYSWRESPLLLGIYHNDNGIFRHSDESDEFNESAESDESGGSDVEMDIDSPHPASYLPRLLLQLPVFHLQNPQNGESIEFRGSLVETKNSTENEY